MPSRRSNSRERSRDRSRDRSRSPERRVQLPNSASPITEADYFQKSDEFRLWLKNEKGKYFDGLSGERARSYFRKFVKAWNRGNLSKNYYVGIDPMSIPATTNTAYKWSFASKRSRVDDDALQAAREQVSAATYGREISSHESGSSSRASGSGRVKGPTLPSASDLTLAREMNAEQQDEMRAYKRRREKVEAKKRVEDAVGPKEVGREGMLEKKRAKRENDRAFRDRGDDGLELDESTLLGGGDSFKDQIAKRDATRKRFENKKAEEREAATRERANAFKEKEKATMDMFQQLAKQRFG